MKTKLKNTINQKIELDKKIMNLSQEIDASIKKIYEIVKKGGKIFLCGNGGSAADAQHLAAEFLVRLKPNKNRQPFPAISLAMDTSTITACSNDYSFVELFSRNFRAFAKKGDILIVITTSGNSKNIIKVLKKAKQKKITSLSILGNLGGKAKKLSDYNIIIPSSNTALIQEEHLFLGHYILNEVEKKLLT